MKKLLNKYLGWIFVLVLVIFYFTALGYRLTVEGAIKASSPDLKPYYKGLKIDRVKEYPWGKYVMAEINSGKGYGIFKVEKKLGGLLWASGGSNGNIQEEVIKAPFSVLGNGELIGVKVKDNNIKYMAAAYLDVNSKKIEDKKYNYDYFKSKENIYKTVKVENGWAVFELKEGEKLFNTFRAFGKDGKIIAYSGQDRDGLYISDEKKSGITTNQNIIGNVDDNGKITLEISINYINNESIKKEIKDKYYMDSDSNFIITNLRIKELSEGLKIKENYNGIDIQGTVKENEMVRFIVEGIAGFSGGGWSTSGGQRLRINIPFYNRNISEYPLEGFNFMMNLPYNSKNITNSEIRVETLNKSEVIKKELYVSNKESMPFIQYGTNNFKDIKKGSISFEFHSLGKKEIEENRKYIKFLIAAAVILGLNNIYLFRKIKGGKTQ